MPSIARSVGNLPQNARESRQEIHDREHGVRCGVRFDLAGPTDNRGGPYRALSRFAELASEGTGIAHVRRPFVAVFPCGSPLRSIVGRKDDNGVVVNAKLLQRVENLANVVSPSIILSP